MRSQNYLVLILAIFILFAFVMGISNTGSAEFLPYPYFGFFNPFVPQFFNSAYPFTVLPPAPAFSAPVLNPLLNPFPATMPTFPSRSAAATLVVLPQPAPTVSAYAPLGTLNLTPSTLVFLILLFTLPE